MLLPDSINEWNSFLTCQEAALTVRLLSKFHCKFNRMTEAHNQFGHVIRMNATSVGSPGSRHFRLVVESKDGHTATIWLEKEQLFNLAIALKNLIAQAEELEPNRSAPQRDEDEGELASVEVQPLELQLGHLVLGYDPESSRYLLAASDIDALEGAPPDLSLLATKEEMEALAEESFEVCAAGRPLCPLCGSPMNTDENHVCPRHNGHAELGETRDIDSH
mgnify:CR=1 FL=1